MAAETTEEIGKRLSTAAQFFLDEEMPVQKDVEKSNATNPSSHDLVVDLLNSAAVTSNDAEKVTALKKVQEYIIHKESNLLDNFLDEMLAFQNDRSLEVKKVVIGFIEAACKVDNEILPKVMANLMIMLSQDAVAVQKRVIQAATQIYKNVLKWLFNVKTITSIMESTWVYMTQIKTKIINLIDSDNDGIRTCAIKFLESIVLIQTRPETDPVKKTDDINIKDIPLDFVLFSEDEIETEAKQIFDSLMVFHGSQHITSVNLMACMGSLCLIAKQRPTLFMSKVVQALEALHVNLPPTLAKSQVNSVRKSLKLNLLNLLKNPNSVDYHDLITTLLTDLGATHQEVVKCLPKPDEIKKRPKPIEKLPSAKKYKVDKQSSAAKAASRSKSDMSSNTAIDITAEKLVPVLHPDNVIYAIIQSMHKLPSVMPPHFQSTYTPIAAAGTEGQKWHLARLIATQLTAAGLGPGVEEIAKISKEKAKMAAEAARLEQMKETQSIKTIIGGSANDKPTDQREHTLLPSGILSGKSKKLGMKQMDLKAITKANSNKSQLHGMSISRILDSQEVAQAQGISKIHRKILASLMTHFFCEESAKIFVEFILEDVQNRLDLAFSWLYEEYAACHGFTITRPANFNNGKSTYDRCFKILVEGLIPNVQAKVKEILFSRLLLEAPCITDSAVTIVKDFCEDEADVALGLSTLKELVIRRPSKRKEFLDIVISLSTHKTFDIREKSIDLLVQLHEREDMKPLIEEHALELIKDLLEPKPPSTHLNVTSQVVSLSSWTEDVVKLFANLFLSLLPGNHGLIHELANVYVTTVPDVKRTILRILEMPVKGMGMDSPELLRLVENCPKGAETLVTRIIHILTDKAPPSSALVARVRDLYHKRVPDVRFLIPVLNGLSKKEVVAALPKLIKLNPVVVKEVFNRLLCNHGDSSGNWTSPVTPAELLIALHNIDTVKCDMKTIIKSTSLCFSEKSVYTQEVLAVVMQQLMEQDPLPTLFMRTVIQSLSLYPKLMGFIMNILQRLIIKQVWKHKKVWEGFIKCCQRTQPQSYQVLLQLPASQLTNVFETTPEMKPALLEHVQSLTEHQKAHVPQAIMEVLEGTLPPVEEEVKKEEPKPVPPPNVVAASSTTAEKESLDPPPPGLES